MSAPRHDHFQTPAGLTVSLYARGHDRHAADVAVEFGRDEVTVALPASAGADAARLTLSLAGPIDPGASTHRVLSSKIELRLAKATPGQWDALLSAPIAVAPWPDAPISAAPSTTMGAAVPAPAVAPTAEPAEAPAPKQAGPSTAAPAGPSHAPAAGSARAPRKNWDKLVDDDDEAAADPNAGGDAALQKFFAQLYASGDPDTRRAMVKSYTESGGTALSVDWAQVGQEKMEVRPPEGMEARKY